MIEVDMINILDGASFSDMIISGANNLSNNRRRVNDLNVFPVPDGDTGTNMSLTAGSISRILGDSKISGIGKAAEKMAYATLRGARGNSGVILSQLFRGISRSLKDKDETDAAGFKDAIKAGADAAYKAVMEPTEGTILTVARFMAEGALLCDSEDICEVLEAAVISGNDALRQTTEMLPALQEAGVVDAGGQGLMLIFEGALEYLKNGTVIENEVPDETAVVQAEAADSEAVSNAAAKIETDIKFQYCTEFIIEKTEKDADADELREAMREKGDCMLVIDDDDVVKVHIHTNHPGQVIEEALKIGEIATLKVDNMKRQHGNLVSPKPDGGKAKKERKNAKKAAKTEPLKKYGFAAVCTGRAMSGILTDLGVDRVIEGGQSMNPSAQDIIKAAARVKAETVFVFPNNKNIIMAANQAAEMLNNAEAKTGTDNKNIIVIPSKTVPQCIRAMVEFNIQKTAEENEKRMLRAMSEVCTGQITYAARDTVIGGNPVKKGDILGLVEDEIRYIGTDIPRVLEKMVSNSIDEDTEYITVYYGKDVKKQDAVKMEEDLANRYPDIEVAFKKGGQPLYYCIVAIE